MRTCCYDAAIFVTLLTGNEPWRTLADPGNLLTFRTQRSDQMGPDGAYDHIGMILQVVRDENGDVDHYVVAMSNSKGPQIVWNVKSGNDPIFPVTGAWKWDTPDRIYSLPNIEVTAANKGPKEIESKGFVPLKPERGWEAEYGLPPF